MRAEQHGCMPTAAKQQAARHPHAMPQLTSHLHSQHPVAVALLHSLGLAHRRVQALPALPPAAARRRRHRDRYRRCRLRGCAWLITSALVKSSASHKRPARPLCSSARVRLSRIDCCRGCQGCHFNLKSHLNTISATYGGLAHPGRWRRRCAAELPCAL